MDLSQLVVPDQPYRLELIHPVNKEPLGVFFDIRSAESDEVKAVVRQSLNERMSKRARTMTAQDVEDELIERAAASIMRWDWGDHELDGEKPKHSHAKACEVLRKYGWIFDQVSAAAEDRANFTRKSSKNSAKPSA